MADERFVIDIILRARDEMSRVLNNAGGSLQKLDAVQQRVNRTMDEFNRAQAKMRNELDKLHAQAEKTRRGIRSIGGEDIKIDVDFDERVIERKLNNLQKSMQTTTKRVEELKLEKEKFDRQWAKSATPGWEKGLVESRERVNNELKKALSDQRGFVKQIQDLEISLPRAKQATRDLKELDAQVQRTVTNMERTANRGGGIGSFLDELKSLKREFERAGGRDFDNRVRLFQRIARDTTPAVRALGNEARRAGSGLRSLGRDADRTGNFLERLDKRVHANRESIAKFDNEIRGMRLLFIVSQFEALVSVVAAAGGQLTALAGSAITAGSALGGALAAGAAQAVPAIGLLAASIARLKAVFDVVGQIDKTRQADATRATSATNTQADATDKLTNASETLADAQRNVADAHKEARQNLEDLIMAERRQRLELSDSEDRVRQLRLQGVTGSELQSAQLDVDENRTQLRRTVAERRTAVRQGVARADNVVQAQRALEQARRGLANAKRDIADGGAAQVAAARQLQFLESQLTQSERHLVKSIQHLRDTWRDVSRPITDVIVQSFDRGVKRAEKILRDPGLGRAFKDLADGQAKEIDRFTTFASRPEQIAFFTRMTRELNRNLEPAGTAALRLTRAFQNIADAAAPTLHRMVQDIARLAGGIERATSNDRDLRALFRYGEVQLRAWFDLALAIGRTIKAIIAPGGDLQSGAAQSGLRTIVDLTERFNKAAQWINEHPMDVNKFFGKSEETWQRVLDLAIKLGKVLLNMFDPRTVDAFADLIEALIPSFEFAADVLSKFTRLFVQIFNLPGFKQLFTTAFGFAFIVRILGRFNGLFLGFIGELTKAGAGISKIGAGIGLWSARLGRSATLMGTLITTTGGLTARWQAATAAAEAYAITVRGAATATAVTAAAPAAAAGRSVTTQAGLGALAAEGGALTAGAKASRGARALGAIKGVGGLAALTAALGFLTTSGGIRERSRGAISQSTLGIVSPEDIRRLADRVRGATSRGPLGAVGRGVLNAIPGAGVLAPLSNLLGSDDSDRLRERAQGALGRTRGLVRREDEVGLTRMAGSLRRLREEAEKLGDTKLAGILTRAANGADRAAKAFDTFRTELGVKMKFDDDDIRSGFWVNSFTDGLERMRKKGVTSIKDFRSDMEEQMENIRRGFKAGSSGAADAIVTQLGAGIKSIQTGMKNGTISVKDGMAEIRRITRTQMRFTKNHMDEFSEQGRAAISRNFRRARTAVENNMGDSEDAVRKGMRVIRRLLADELEAFGIDPAKARRISKLTTDEDTAFLVAGHGPAPKAGGGWIGRMGERGRDAVHTVLGRGEAVLNWGHQKMIEPAMNAYYGSGLDEMFRRTKGFHAGGMESALGFARGRRSGFNINGMLAAAQRLEKSHFAYRWGGGHQGSPAPFGPMDCSGAVSYVLQHGGINIPTMVSGALMSAGQPGPGTVTVFANPEHTFMRIGDRYFGTSQTNPGGGAGWFPDPGSAYKSRFTQRHFGAADAQGGSGEIGTIDRIKILGAHGDSALRRISQRAVDIGTKGANVRLRQLARKLGATGGGQSGDPGPAPPGQLRTWLAKALRITEHFSPGNLNALYGRAMQESGGNPRAINNWDSNAKAGTPSKGLLQTIDPTFNAYKLPGHGNIWNPIDNAIAAIRYMFSRYGHVVGPSSTGYAKGGIIPGMIGAAKSIIAHGGEWVLNPMQQAKAAIAAGTTPDRLAGALGFTGGPTSYAGGGIIVGDSLGVGTAEFLKNFKANVEQGRRSAEALEILRQMLRANPKRRNVIFDAGTNDDNPEQLRRVLRQVVRAVGDRNLLIPTVGGPNAKAKNEVIRSFSDQATIFNWRQMAQNQGLLGGDNIHATGKGYQARADAIVAAFKKGGSGSGGASNLFELPSFLPPEFKDFAALIKDFFKHVKSLDTKGSKNFKQINANIALLAKDGGLLDNLGSTLTDRITSLQSIALRSQFRVRGGVVRQRFGQIGADERSLNTLQFEGRGLGRIGRFINRGLRVTQRNINQIRRGGVTDDEQDQLDDLLTNRLNLRRRRVANRQAIGENLQSRFETQGGLIESRLARNLRGPLRRLASSQAAQRIAQAFGRGGDINFIDQQIRAYTDQKPAILQALRRARRQKNTELADSLIEQLRDIDGSINELIASRMQSQIEEMERNFGRFNSAIDFRERMAQATGTLGLNRLIPGIGGTRAQNFQARDSVLRANIQQVQILRFIAASQHNVTALDQLTQTLLDLQVQLQENTRALFLAKVEDVNRVAGAATGLAATRGRIAELKGTLGIITGPEAQAEQKAQLQAAAAALLTQGSSLKALLAEATARGDEESIISLTQAVADNELATLENTQAIKELDGSINDTQSFSSTAWEWFRTAVFNGSGGLLPQFAMPTGIGGMGTGIITAPNFSVNGAGGGAIAPVNVEINQAGEVVDPTYVGNVISFATRTNGT